MTLYGADLKTRCATPAFAIGPPFQGRGLGRGTLRTLVRHGFTELGLHRIELAVNVDNAPRDAAVGFLQEGPRRGAYFRHGGWHDQIQMGLPAEEWEDRPEAV